jgi:hypothetical protein
MTTGAERRREQRSRREEEEGVAMRRHKDGTGTGNFWVRHGDRRNDHPGAAAVAGLPEVGFTASASPWLGSSGRE